MECVPTEIPRSESEEFFALVVGHRDRVRAVCLRLVGNQEEAEDLAQETLIRAVEKRALFDRDRPILPWLLTMAGNLSRSRVRTVWWRRVEDAPVLASLAGLADEGLLDAEKEDLVREHVLALPDAIREAVILHDLQSMTYAEIAQVSGDSVSALKRRVRQGRELLRRSLSEAL